MSIFRVLGYTHHSQYPKDRKAKHKEEHKEKKQKKNVMFSTLVYLIHLFDGPIILFIFISLFYYIITLTNNNKEVDVSQLIFTLQELKDTELSYLTGLRQCNQMFIEPILKNQLITNEYLCNRLNELQTIENVNSKFYEKLTKKYQKNISTLQKEQVFELINEIVKLFLYFAPSFKLYSPYITNYTKMIEELKKEKENNSKLVKLLQQQKFKCEEKGMRITNLEGLLITAVQRIPRYKLLLQDLQKRIPSSKELEKSIQIIQSIACHLNLKELEMENQKKTKHLIHKFKLRKFLQPNRHLLFDFCKKENSTINYKNRSKNFKVCELFIFNDVLLIHKRCDSKLFAKVELIFQQGSKIISPRESVNDVAVNTTVDVNNTSFTSTTTTAAVVNNNSQQQVVTTHKVFTIDKPSLTVNKENMEITINYSNLTEVSHNKKVEKNIIFSCSDNGQLKLLEQYLNKFVAQENL
ncbi:hypothetical protein ABK040_015626 [Willaertia magna]